MVVLSAALAPALLSCGGDGALASCGKVAACGGDVVGNYTIAGACVNNSALNMNVGLDCPGATALASGVSASGSASFNADLTYTMTQTLTASVTEMIPASCLTQNGLTLTCTQVDQLLQTLIQMEPGTFQSAHCSGNTSCTCSFVLAPQMMTESGTYVAAGTTLTLTASDGSSSSGSYCVQGNNLHLLSMDMTMPMGTITADTVLTKK
jgi:hypothetical protein